MSYKLTKFVEEFDLKVLHKGSNYEEAEIEVPDLNRPGLQFHHFYEYFEPKRLQVVGFAENNYLMSLSSEERRRSLDSLFAYDIPALVLCRGLECSEECMASAKEYGRTILQSDEITVKFTTLVTEHLDRVLAKCITRHGVLLDVHGEGVMITGESGVGKSETAIELIMRGHRLVADDAVELRRISDTIIGTAPALIQNYIELRGIGIIDVRQLFGMRTIKQHSHVDMIVHLEPWDQTKFYDRLGIEDHFTEILGVQVPIVTIPVRPGRNLATIIEVAAMNNRNRRYGYNAAAELSRRIEEMAESGQM